MCDNSFALLFICSKKICYIMCIISIQLTKILLIADFWKYFII